MTGASEDRTSAPGAAATAADHVLLADLLAALSHALDLTEGQAEGHCLRCCWIGVRIGQELGLPEAQLADLSYTLILKDLGCSSNAARICELYLADDRTIKSGSKHLDGSLKQALRFVLAHTGLQAGPAERLRAIVRIVRNGGRLTRELIETRCVRGAEIARLMRFSDAVARGIRGLDEHWDGSGKPGGLKGTAIPLFSRIALLAQVADVFFTAGGPEAAVAEVTSRADGWFEPRLVEAFRRVAAQPGFWETLASAELQEAIAGQVPLHVRATVDDDYLDDIAAAFAQVIDAKSPFTAGHSARVTDVADTIAAEMGLPDLRRRWLRRAALLHDIGKLGVSNTILDKPGPLEPEERAAMQRHAELSETILARIRPFRHLAAVAGAHHERLDGKGYPRGLSGAAIDLDTRIITTADIFDALTADRPYRAAMSVARALEIMEEMSGTALDPACLAALRRTLDRPPVPDDSPPTPLR
ncbi:HD-GYP domain-containing protein [Azorhizobium caulinodans]|uniref:HD-GYP domain-containing protein n=1 Tax=Azorhizobium caulinodans TaxID=7 RepID=UPI002FBD6AD6